MRVVAAYAIMSGFLTLAACDFSSPTTAPATVSAPEPAAPRPELVSLTGCTIVVETVARERLIAAKRVAKQESGVYLQKMTGETSGGEYDVECVSGEKGIELRIVHGPSIGSVSKSDLEGHKSAALNSGVLGVGEEVSIAERFAYAGEVDSDGFLDFFFGAIRVEIPEDGQYCLGVVAKFAGTSGAGSTNLAIDDGPWINWGHPVEDGVNFTSSDPQALKAGEHTVYLQKREDKLSRFRIGKC